MIDLMVQAAIALAVLGMVVLLVAASNRGGNQRERILRHGSHRRWWNRTHNGH